MGFFDIGIQEIIIVLVVALLVLGPKRLPEVARKMGEIYRNLRKITGDFTKEFTKAIDIEDKELKDIAKSVKDDTGKLGKAIDTETKELTKTVDTKTKGNLRHQRRRHAQSDARGGRGGGGAHCLYLQCRCPRPA